MKKTISYLLLCSFVFQIGHSMAIGNIINKLFCEISSFYSDDSELGFFDFVFKDVLCESQQNEEETQKSLSNDLILDSNVADQLTSNYTSEQKLYMLLSALFPSGFYLSLIQPPD